MKSVRSKSTEGLSDAVDRSYEQTGGRMGGGAGEHLALATASSDGPARLFAAHRLALASLERTIVRGCDAK